MTAAEYLEVLQQQQASGRRTPRQTPGRLDQIVPPEKMRPGFEKHGISDPEELAAADRFYREHFVDVESRMPSKLEDAWSYSILESLAKRLLEAVEGTDWTLPEMPVFGTLPLGFIIESNLLSDLGLDDDAVARCLALGYVWDYPF